MKKTLPRLPKLGLLTIAIALTHSTFTLNAFAQAASAQVMDTEGIKIEKTAGLYDGKDLGEYGFSKITHLSDDGSTAVGQRFDSNYIFDALVFSSNAKTGIKSAALPFLKREEGESSAEALAISGDGKVIAGMTDNGSDSVAVLWHGDNWQQIHKLSSASSDKSPTVHGLSHDGKTVVGRMPGIGKNFGAVVWSGDNWQHTALKTWTPANASPTDSEARAISSDGKIIVGGVETKDDPDGYKAVVWSGDNWQTLTQLGSLKNDRKGAATALTINRLGKIIAGVSDNDGDNKQQGIVWSGDNWQQITQLPVVKNDAYKGWISEPAAISDEGSFIVGKIDEGSGNQYRAVLWQGKNWQDVMLLPELDTNAESKQSEAVAISKDNKIIAGSSNNRAVFWYVKNPPKNPLLIDKARTESSFAALAQDMQTLIAHKHYLLNSLQHTSMCASRFCVSVWQDWQKQAGNSLTGQGLHLGINLDRITAGFNLKQHDTSSPLAHRQTGGLAAGSFIRYAPAGQSWYVGASAAYDNQPITITRQIADNTTATADSTVRSTGFALELGQYLHKWHWYGALRQQNIVRGAYQENTPDIGFNVGAVRQQNTTLALGIDGSHALSDKWQLLAGAEFEKDLQAKHSPYQASNTYFGNMSYPLAVAAVRFYGQAGIAYRPMPFLQVQLMPYMGKNASGDFYTGGLLRFSSNF